MARRRAISGVFSTTLRKRRLATPRAATATMRKIKRPRTCRCRESCSKRVRWVSCQGWGKKRLPARAHPTSRARQGSFKRTWYPWASRPERRFTLSRSVKAKPLSMR